MLIRLGLRALRQQHDTTWLYQPMSNLPLSLWPQGRTLSSAAGKDPSQVAVQPPPSDVSVEDRPVSGWTEVVHEATGQTYYWNTRTGQTTALGEPRPGSRSSSGDSSGAGGAGGAGSDSSEGVDPRAEMPLPDKTGQYAAVGVFLGVFFGWASQFF